MAGIKAGDFCDAVATIPREAILVLDVASGTFDVYLGKDRVGVLTMASPQFSSTLKE